jgi:hypothetical protein
VIHWEDLDLSKIFGNSRQIWPVYEDYAIDGEWIRPTSSKYEKSLPMAHPELPFKFAEILESHDVTEAALAFVREWGFLGLRQMESASADPEPKELVEWIIVQANEVQDILTLINEGDKLNILGAIKLEGIHFALVTATDQADTAYEYEYKTVSSPFMQLGGEKMHTMTHHAPPGVELDGVPTILAVEMRWRCLLDVIHWHLASYAVGLRTLKRCEECGRHFEKTHGKQRYCPPEHTDGFSRAQSNCSGRRRARRFREKKKSHNAT